MDLANKRQERLDKQERSKKKKLLYIINVDYFLISHRLPIAIAAKDSGYEVHVAAQITNYADQIRSYGFILHNLDIKRTTTGFISLSRTFLSIIKIVKSVKPSIIHFVSIKPVLLGGLALHFFKRKPLIVASVSGLGYIFISEGLKAYIRKRLVLILYRLAFNHEKLKVIFQNSSDLETITNLSKVSLSKTLLIPGSGVDLNKFKSTALPKGKPIVLFPARLVVSKGIFEFIHAAETLKGIARFVISGSLDSESADAISSQELNEWVSKKIIEYWGFSENMAETISKSSIVVLPSYREGLPKVISEAAACGRAVITTDVPGCRDAIIPEKTGLLVPLKNKYELAKKIKSLLNDPERINRMGENARSFAENTFDINNVTSIHLDIYNEIA